MSWIKELFDTNKPIIAMVHMEALPGDPGYDFKKGMQWILDRVSEICFFTRNGGCI
jgi:predicted TIM-barrel enzyme